jgi:hypothetical protein
MAQACAARRESGGMNSGTAREISPPYLGQLYRREIKILNFLPFRARPPFNI